MKIRKNEYKLDRDMEMNLSKEKGSGKADQVKGRRRRSIRHKDNQTKSKKVCSDNGLTNMQSFPVFLKNEVQLEMVS